MAMPVAALSQPSPSPGPGPAGAQPGAPPGKPPDAATLDARIKALAADLEDVKDENADLKSELADLKARQAANKPPASLNALNPQITAFLNGAMRVDDRQVLTPGGVAIDDRPFLRTAEFDFRAAVDRYADAVAILSLADEAGTGFGGDAPAAADRAAARHRERRVLRVRVQPGRRRGRGHPAERGRGRGDGADRRRGRRRRHRDRRRPARSPGLHRPLQPVLHAGRHPRRQPRAVGLLP